MADFVRVYTTVPEQLLALLTKQLPYSLPLLRRLQFTKFENGLRETARVILVAESQLEEGADLPKRFTAAYIDVGGGPDTQMWIYSTLEHPDNADTNDTAVYEQQLQKIVEESVVIAKAYGHPLVYGEAVLVGTLHDSVRDLLSKTGRVQARETGAYDKWLFKYEDLPKEEIALPKGMHWGTATDDDCRVVISRTNIPRTVQVLRRMPSLVIKLDDGTPVSWAFLGFDGSLISLHCEEPYRRRGLAKTLAAKLFREKSLDFADDGWCSADVAPDNDGSRGMCKRLNGKPTWRVSWVLLFVGEKPPSETNGTRNA
ncbi:gnat family protein [Fusarium globosum]|uniref:Gnat family protein n=1 Tax=Fusarium globosum TaxID=78864 RepID=A0A8H6D056_9HYPO|nr:gnat family protein [Fusarium globosum]